MKRQQCIKKNASVAVSQENHLKVLQFGAVSYVGIKKRVSYVLKATACDWLSEPKWEIMPDTDKPIEK